MLRPYIQISLLGVITTRSHYPVKSLLQLKLDLGHQLSLGVQPTLSDSRNPGFQPVL